MNTVQSCHRKTETRSWAIVRLCWLKYKRHRTTHRRSLVNDGEEAVVGIRTILFAELVEHLVTVFASGLLVIRKCKAIPFSSPFSLLICLRLWASSRSDTIERSAWPTTLTTKSHFHVTDPTGEGAGPRH